MTQRSSRAWPWLALAFFIVPHGSTMAASATLSIPAVKGAAGSTATVPIIVRSAEGLGALQFELAYDPLVAEPTAAEPGELVSGLVDFNVIAPGRARVAMATNQAVSGDGEIIVLSFAVRGGKETRLTFHEVRAWEQATSHEMMVTAEPGTLTVGGGLPSDATLALLAAAFLLAMLAVTVAVVVWLVLRRKSTATR